MAKATGRVPRLVKDPTLKDRVASLLAAGHYAETACDALGIPESTYYAWLERGEAVQGTVQRAEDPDTAVAELGDNERAYMDFWEAVKKASAAAEVRNLKVVTEAAHDGTWQAAAWYLERRHPRRWGRFDRLEVNDNPIEDPIAEAALKDRGIRAMVDDLLDSLVLDSGACGDEGSD